jgi:hypothetical protein
MVFLFLNQKKGSLKMLAKWLFVLAICAAVIVILWDDGYSQTVDCRPAVLHKNRFECNALKLKCTKAGNNWIYAQGKCQPKTPAPPVPPPQPPPLKPIKKIRCVPGSYENCKALPYSEVCKRSATLCDFLKLLYCHTATQTVSVQLRADGFLQPADLPDGCNFRLTAPAKMQFVINLGLRDSFEFGPNLLKAMRDSGASIGVLHNGQSDFYILD